MAAIKLVEDYAVSSLRNDVRDSLIMGGEQCILMQLFHPGTDADAERCPNCTDDIYEGGEQNCTICYGTTFRGGVKSTRLCYGIFTDRPQGEQTARHGTYEPDVREFQTEAFPFLMEHDIIVRIRRWDEFNRPAEIKGFYKVTEVNRVSLRTGSRFAQDDWDVVAQSAMMARVADNLSITTFPVIGETFTETPTSPNSASMSVYNPPVVTPDTRVVFIPADGEDSELSRQPYTHVQTVPATTWVIPHPLDHYPSVTVIVNQELVEPDVTYPSMEEVTIVFAEATSGIAVLV